MLVVNPAVPPSLPGLQVARERGADITTEIDLDSFLSNFGKLV